MTRFQETWSRVITRTRAAASWVVQEARLIVDLDQFVASSTWQERLEAVSWKRAAVATGSVAAVAFAAGLGLWLIQPEFRGRPPRLPTEQEWRANQEAGRAMEAELSPALAEANKAVPN